MLDPPLGPSRPSSHSSVESTSDAWTRISPRLMEYSKLRKLDSAHLVNLTMRSAFASLWVPFEAFRYAPVPSGQNGRTVSAQLKDLYLLAVVKCRSPLDSSVGRFDWTFNEKDLGPVCRFLLFSERGSPIRLLLPPSSLLRVLATWISNCGAVADGTHLSF